MPDKIRPSEVSEVLLQQLKGINTSIQFDEVGAVLQVSDGVARIYGLLHAEANELLEFENGVMGVVMNLEEDNVGAVLLGATDLIKEGMIVKRTGRIASIRVSENMLGRVIDPLGVPLDGRGTVGGELFEMPLERKAPGVIYRQPVSEPLQTGIKAIDAMIPIGRGQRELIIGDRQTGKTAIAIDTIINQRSAYEAGKPVYCIYVAIGQKGSTVANIVNTLREKGAMDYTVVVAATAADPAALQYFAPFAGAAIGEYFRDTGRHALVVFDDLSKQAVAYREVSLILRRPSGREAYPGDIFYLHSRLLERAAKIINQQEVAEQMNDLPESLKTIGKEAFSGTGLLSVSLPSRIDSIGESAFSGCDKLVSATLPENLTTIPASMFSRCYALAAISIPASVEYIGDEAFYSCLGLKEITSFNPVPPVCEPFYGENWTMVFDGVNPEHCTLKIPTGSTASYAAAVGWDMFYLCEEFDPSGIQGVLKGKASGKTVHYDLNGRMIPSNAKGIHIVREADGSCRKIWVK